MLSETLTVLQAKDGDMRAGAAQEVEAMRDLYRQEANCQIICDSLLRRGLADPYLIVVEVRRAGYGASGTSMT